MPPFGEGPRPIPEAHKAKVVERHNLRFDVTDDPEEAADIVRDLLARGERPLITIPDEWIDKVREEGIPLIGKFDRLSGKHYQVTAARLGADPFLPKGEMRYVAEVDPSDLNVQPRLTGTPEGFYGTVVFPRGIPKEKIRILGKFDRESWEMRDQAPEEARKAS